MEEQKHSGLGIASFVTSVVTAGLIFLMFIIAGVMESTTPGGIDENSPAAIIVGLCILGLLALDLLAVGLGIGGLVQSEHKKLFAALGTAFAGITLLGTILLIIIGNAL
ncbi:hypothetical protein [Chitinilyticum aquatile]|uniref:hypothetical protein n=1 Tax=Chitinilyticum aquatile TaxID=362520 RepID=UPI00041FFE38|nr:hypothetical protein [Chitinilyticum aquatile]